MNKKQKEIFEQILEISETIGIRKNEFANAIHDNRYANEIDELREELFELKIERNKLITEFDK